MVIENILKHINFTYTTTVKKYRNVYNVEIFILIYCIIKISKRFTFNHTRYLYQR